MKNEIYIAIVLIAFFGCRKNTPNFLLDEFPELVSNSWEDKSLLKTFKETPFESAITDHPEFKIAFNQSSKKISQLANFEIQFKESLKLNELEYWDTSNSLLLLAMFHKTINQEKFQLLELKKFTDLQYIKHQILIQDNININEDENCYVKQLSTINEWLIDSLHKINYLDADLVLRASNKACISNVEYLELYNETLFNYLKHKPNDIIELLEEGNYNAIVFEVIKENLRNPINGEIELEKILQKLNVLNQSNSRNKIINSLKIAVQKYEKPTANTR